ncbi:hypothetical protein OHA72_11110 [Dactylosporangium sp. NBC_01737]|uniref:hypothetical protein n=1 Tax=Dactylosporangium sp. NBC_01737 TaxID=2975959 RepID=UPI002E0EAF9C|nr:hypothetical protein OHA72_11110 [Dactylosporangium sp. NBC_01737]
MLARLVDASMMEADFFGTTRFRMLETLRAFGLDRLAAAGEDGAATARMLRWAVELTAWAAQTMTTEREPDADAVLRRELPNLRAAWRLARSLDTLDDAAAIIVALIDTVSYRDLVEVRGWAEELADDPALATHPAVAMVLGTAAEAAYHRGDHQRAERLARDGLERATAGNPLPRKGCGDCGADCPTAPRGCPTSGLVFLGRSSLARRASSPPVRKPYYPICSEKYRTAIHC